MARHPDASKQRRWLDLMHRWQQSQLTVREFCERLRLSQPSFYLWRRVLRERGLLHDLPAPIQAAAAASPTTFVKLLVDAAPATTTAVDLVLSERRLLRVHPGFDPASLLQLVRLLEEPT
jgi:transposase